MLADAKVWTRLPPPQIVQPNSVLTGVGMTAPKGLRPSYQAATMDETKTWSTAPPFFAVTVDWKTPQPWSMTERHDLSKVVEPDLLYVIITDHHRSKTWSNIAYVGLTTKAGSRFANHPTATRLRGRPGSTSISFGVPSFGRRRDYKVDAKPALEELEHLLIWALSPDHNLYNERKLSTLPGMGSNSGRAWHVTNTGHRFHGRMPIEIVYPWMLVRSGRDRSLKPKTQF